MGYPGHPPYPGYPPPPAKPPRSTADLTISIILMVLTVVVGAGGAFMGLLMLAFLDYCPPETCSVEGAVTSVLTAVAAAALVVIAGIIVTIITLVRRKPGWPFALGTFVLCMAVLFIGGVAFFAAVGG
jgi:hypothetical protein